MARVSDNAGTGNDKRMAKHGNTVLSVAKAVAPHPKSITAIQILTAIALAVGILLTNSLLTKHTPAEYWITTASLTIPDHIIGLEDDTVIEYKRDVKHDFNGRYYVEIQRVTAYGFEDIQHCKSDVKTFKADSNPLVTTSLGTLKGDDCKWSRSLNTQFLGGQYRICIVWEVLYNSKVTTPLCSNIYKKNNPKFLKNPS